jgi:hypothetical protein
VISIDQKEITEIKLNNILRKEHHILVDKGLPTIQEHTSSLGCFKVISIDQKEITEIKLNNILAEDI